jgi:large subunit ribosomal protein L6
MTPKLEYELTEKQVNVTRKNENKESMALHGLTRTLLNNMVEGVTNGYSRKLEITGVGYRAENKGKNMVLHLGFSHPILFMPPAEVNLEATSQTEIAVHGIDKELVGQVAAKIRSLRKPEPYKGKGIRYAGEHIIRKAGKSGKA